MSRFQTKLKHRERMSKTKGNGNVEGSAGVDAYIAAAAPEARPVLKKIRSLLKRVVPAATETISYRIPALRLGRVFFYYAAFKKHIGVFPPVRSDKKLVKELERYRGPKGNLQFPLDEPMPYKLIGRVAAALAKEYGKVEGVKSSLKSKH
jgi:uncharacterized protein YdhG (YjbR/CyaY superfamily)